MNHRRHLQISRKAVLCAVGRVAFAAATGAAFGILAYLISNLAIAGWLVGLTVLTLVWMAVTGDSSSAARTFLD